MSGDEVWRPPTQCYLQARSHGGGGGGGGGTGGTWPPKFSKIGWTFLDPFFFFLDRIYMYVPPPPPPPQTPISGYVPGYLGYAYACSLLLKTPPKSVCVKSILCMYEPDFGADILPDILVTRMRSFRPRSGGGGGVKVVNFANRWWEGIPQARSNRGNCPVSISLEIWVNYLERRPDGRSPGRRWSTPLDLSSCPGRNSIRIRSYWTIRNH